MKKTVEDWIEPYLIQRLLKPKNFVNPFDGVSRDFLKNNALFINQNLFTFDYMGSAEFEFGAVPKALGMLFNIANEKK